MITNSRLKDHRPRAHTMHASITGDFRDDTRRKLVVEN